MDSKKFMAIMAVTIMIICPLAVACTSVDADSNKDEKALLITSNDKTKAFGVFNENVLDVLSKSALMLKSIDDTKVTPGELKLTNLGMKVGAKNIADNEKYSSESLYDLTFDFEQMIKVDTTGKIFTVETIPSYLSGDGIEVIKNFLNKDFAKDQEITLKGTVKMRLLISMDIDLYKNNDLGMTPKKIAAKVLLEGISDTKIAVKNGDTLNIKQETRNNLTQDLEYVYSGKEWKDVKAEDSGKLKPTNFNFNKADAKFEVTMNDSKKDVKINMDTFKNSIKESAGFGKESDVKAGFVKTLNADVGINNVAFSFGGIKFINDFGTLDALKTAAKTAGTCNEDVSQYNKSADDIKSDVGSSSSNGIPTWVWIVVAVVIVLIVAGLVWYFKFRNNA